METISKITAAVSSTRKGPRPGFDIADSLREAGMTVLGSGAFGAVTKSDEGVFKIFAKDEQGYGEYLNYMKGRWSVLSPRVTLLSGGATTDKWTVIKIEELTSINNDDMMAELGITMKDVQDMGNFIYYYIQRRKWARQGNKNNGKLRAPAWMNKVVDLKNFKGYLDKMMDHADKVERETGVVLYWDLHYGNVMIRRDENAIRPLQLVITDPWCV